MNTIPVFYNQAMVADSGGYSPSAAKPRQVFSDWSASDIAFENKGFSPLGLSAMWEAHDHDYVTGVMGCTIPNGHGNRSRELATSLHWTTGSHYAAAKEALANGCVACSPTSGFHHAGYDFGGGYCTLNGLMISSMLLLNAGSVDRVAVWDLDWHGGNGTEDIVDRLGVEDQFLLMDNGYGDDVSFFEDMDRHISELDAFQPDIVMYQAGADPFIDDPLGGALTIEQLRERDRIVFDWCRSNRVPVVWNLAGGYTRDRFGDIPLVLEIHRNTMKECVASYVGERTAAGC